MWSRRLLPLIIIVFFASTSCKRPCDRLSIHHAHELRKEAFIKWEKSLDYMDGDMITEAKYFLECSLEEHAACSPYDKRILLYIDSVSYWNSAIAPKTEELERSGQYVDSIRTWLLTDN